MINRVLPTADRLVSSGYRLYALDTLDHYIRSCSRSAPS
nr:MAG TPA: hypothetical protein [Caudoviricetes sp.]